MKKTHLLSLAAASCLVISGCASTNMNQPSTPMASTLDVSFKADVSVGEKISGQSNSTVILGFITLGDTKYADGVSYSGVTGGASSFLDFGPTAAAKSAAAYKAVTANDADLIINPRYTVDEVNYFVFKKIRATVSGNKGTINSISQSK